MRRTRSHPDSADRLVGAGRHRRRRGRGDRWPSCAACRRPTRASASTPRWSRCRGGSGCGRASAARRRRSSPSCGARCSGAGPRGVAREKLAPRLGPPAPPREGGRGRGRGGGRGVPADDVAPRAGPPRALRGGVARGRRSSTRRRSQRLMEEDPDEALALLADLTGRHRSRACGSWPAGWPGGSSSTWPAGPRPPAGRRQASSPSPSSPTAATSTSTPASRRWPRPAPTARAPDAERPAGPGLGASRARRCAWWSTAAGRWAGGRWPPPRVAAAAVAWRAPDGLQRARLRPGRRRGQGPGRIPSRRRRWSTTCWRCGASAPPTSPARCRWRRRSWQRSRAGRRVAVLLSDCRATVPGDVVGAARGLDELCIVAPAGDAEEARELAASVGARFATVDGPSQIPEALAAVLGELTARPPRPSDAHRFRAAFGRRSAAPLAVARRLHRGRGLAGVGSRACVTGRWGRRAGRCRRRCPR